jgi:hypothetical protein
MRKLNAKQKQLLVKVLKKENEIYSYGDLGIELKLELDIINDFEILIDEVNRFIWDYNAKKLRGI